MNSTLDVDGYAFRHSAEPKRIRISEDTLTMAAHLQRLNAADGLPRSLEYLFAMLVCEVYKRLAAEGLVPPNP